MGGLSWWTTIVPFGCFLRQSKICWAAAKCPFHGAIKYCERALNAQYTSKRPRLIHQLMLLMRDQDQEFSSGQNNSDLSFSGLQLMSNGVLDGVNVVSHINLSVPIHIFLSRYGWIDHNIDSMFEVAGQYQQQDKTVDNQRFSVHIAF